MIVGGQSTKSKGVSEKSRGGQEQSRGGEEQSGSGQEQTGSGQKQSGSGPEPSRSGLGQPAREPGQSGIMMKKSVKAGHGSKRSQLDSENEVDTGPLTCQVEGCLSENKVFAKQRYYTIHTRQVLFYLVLYFQKEKFRS